MSLAAGLAASRDTLGHRARAAELQALAAHVGTLCLDSARSQEGTGPCGAVMEGDSKREQLSSYSKPG